MKILLLMGLVSLSSIAFADTCEQQKVTYEKLLSSLNTSCSAASDCVSSDLAWGGCGPLTVHNKKSGAKVLGARRAKLWKQCGFVVPPCAIAPVTADCVGGHCAPRAESAK